MKYAPFDDVPLADPTLYHTLVGSLLYLIIITHTPQVSDLARPVPPAARPCQPSGCSFAAFASQTSYLLVYV